ncbi:MAG: Ig-like domain-containing protein [Thermoplasmata archaeon]|nr:MAG: Ig-like domain-containing protein [Thermoplasmata archaeon]
MIRSWVIAITMVILLLISSFPVIDNNSEDYTPDLNIIDEDSEGFGSPNVVESGEEAQTRGNSDGRAIENSEYSLNWTTRQSPYENDANTSLLLHFDDTYYGEDSERAGGVDSGCIGLWRFEDGNGSIVNDSSGGGHHGTWKGEPNGNWIEGIYGYGMEFDGVDDYVEIPHSSDLIPSKEITIEVWVKPKDITTSTYCTIYRKEGVSSRHLLAFQDNGKVLCFGLQTGGSYVELDVSIEPSDYTDGQWHYIVCTYDGTVKKVYTDGIEIGSDPTSGAISTGMNENGFIGSNSGVSEYFNGAIDEVGIYNRSKTAREVEASYKNRVSRYTGTTFERGKFGSGLTINGNDTLTYPIGPGIDESCRGHWTFNEGSGTSTADSSVFGHHGSITGATWVDGKYGKALEFDGTNDYVDITNTPQLIPENFTIECSVYLKKDYTSSESGVIISNEFQRASEFGEPWTHTYGYTLSINYAGIMATNRLVFALGNRLPARDAIYYDSLEKERWYRIAATYSGTHMRLYVDYKEVASKAKTKLYSWSQNNMQIGKDPTFNTYINAIIDDVAIYNRSKSSLEIYQYKDRLENLNLHQNTLEMWVKPYWNGTNSSEFVFFDEKGYNPTTDRILLRKEAMSSDLFFSIGSQEISENISQWQSHEWHHIAVSWNASKMQLFIDGILEATKSSITLPQGYDVHMYIGSDYNRTNQSSAVLDELRISNCVRTAEEIREYYRMGLYEHDVIDSGEKVDWETISWDEKLLEGDEKIQPDSSTVGLWHFNEGYGTVINDQSPNHNNGELVDGSWTEGIYGNALLFDGTNDAVNCKNDQSVKLGTNSFTIMGWFKTGTSGQWQQIVAKGGYSWTCGYFIRINNQNRLNWHIFGDKLTQGEQPDTPSYGNGSTVVTDNKWHHFGLVADLSSGINTKLYLDGKLDGAASNTSSIGSTDNNKNLAIGAYAYFPPNTYGTYFQGKIDEIAIYKRVFTEAELIEQYEQRESSVYLQSRTSEDGLTWTDWTGTDDVPHANERVSSAGENGTLLNLQFDGSYSGYDNESIVKKPEVVDTSDPYLMGYWKLDSIKGNNTVDYSLHGNDGMVIGAKVAQGVVGNAYDFDGKYDYIDVPADESLNITGNFTIEAWVYPTEAVPQTVLIKGTHTGDSKDSNYNLLWVGDRFTCRLGNGNMHDIVTENSTAALNEWYHLIVIGNWTKLLIYRNGILTGISSRSITPLPVSDTLRIGRGYFTNYEFNGLIDEVAIYNRTLTPDEIALHASNPGYSQGTLLTTGKFSSGVEVNDNDVLSYPTGYDSVWGFPEGSGSLTSGHNGYKYARLGDASIGDAYEPKWTAAGKYGTALEFDGVDDSIRIENDPDLLIGGVDKSFTLEAWANRASNDSYDTVIFQGTYPNQSTSYNLQMGYLNSNSYVFGFYGDDLNVGTGSIDVNEWRHLVATYDGITNIQKLYRDGKLLQSRTTNNDYMAMLTSLYIGRVNWVWGGFFSGTIDEVAVHNYVLSAEEIYQRYLGNLDPGNGTISFWFKPYWSGGDNSEHILFDAGNFGENNPNSIYLRKSEDDNLIFTITNSTGTSYSASYSLNFSNFKAYNWHHISASWDKSSIKLYLDGALVASNSFAGILNQLSSYIFIGSQPNNKSNRADGVFDDFQIYNYVKAQHLLMAKGHTNAQSSPLEAPHSRYIQWRSVLQTRDIELTPILSNVVIKYNNIPYATSVQITPSSPTIFDDITVQYTFNDKNGDPEKQALYRWYVNRGSGFVDSGFTSGTVSASETRLDDIWKCRLTPYDGKAYGTPVNSSTVTIGKGPLARIKVTPEFDTMTTDEQYQFSAQGYDAANNMLDIEPVWDVSGGGTISTSGRFDPVSVGTFMVYANLSGISGSATIEVKHGNLHHIIITPSNPSITADEYIDFSALGADQDDNTFEITAGWAASGGGTIDSTGRFAAATVGLWTVWANASGISGSTTVNVTAGSLHRLEVSPSTTAATAGGVPVIFSAAGFDEDSNSVSVSPSWSVSGGGTIDASSGIFSPTTTGSWIVTAAVDNIVDYATVNVNPGSLAEIKISPQDQSISADDTIQFFAEGYDLHGNALSSISVNWASTNGEISTMGKFKPFSTGTVTIYANSSGVSGSTKVTVTPGILSSITIDPSSASVDADSTVDFNVIGADTNGNEVTVESVTWEAENGEITDDGLFIPELVGTWKISAKTGTISDNAEVSVNHGKLARLEIVPSQMTLVVDDSVDLSLNGYDAKNNKWQPAVTEVTWQMNNDSVAGISASGKVSAKAAGMTFVEALKGDIKAYAYITVLSKDTDNDGIVDELDAFPEDSSEWKDSDGDGVGDNNDTDDDNDGMSDEYETEYGLNPLLDDSKWDNDGDGLSNLEESELETDPVNWDSDGDGASDKSEFDENTDPLDTTQAPKIIEKQEEGEGSNSLLIGIIIILVIIIVILVLMIIRREKELAQKDDEAIADMEQQLKKAQELGLPTGQFKKIIGDAKKLSETKKGKDRGD